MDPILINASSLLLACVFGGAAWHKWRHASGFRQILADYRIAPAGMVAPLARLLPFLEAGAAAGLVLPGTASAAAVLAASLLLLYSAAIGINLLRGRRALDCGCGGPGQRLSEWLLLRNAVLLTLACIAAVDGIGRPLSILDWAVTLLAVASGFLCYLIVNQLLANADARGVPRGTHA